MGSKIDLILKTGKNSELRSDMDLIIKFYRQYVDKVVFYFPDF
jgi:hypothetical protein